MESVEELKALIQQQNKTIATLIDENQKLKEELLNAYRTNRVRGKSVADKLIRSNEVELRKLAIDALKQHGELNQQQLLAFIGKTKADRSALRFLHKNIDTLWKVRADGKSIIYSILDGVE